MNERSIERLITRLAEGNLTDEEHRQLLGLVRNGTHERMIKDMLYHHQLRYVQATQEFVRTSFTEAEHRSARQRGDRTLQNILTIIQEERNEQEAAVIPLYRSWARMAAAAALIIASLTGGYWYYRTQAEASVIAHTRVFENKQFIHLPDGSTVLLNAGSRLSYHDSFGDTVREVTLTGEAFFDVKHDPAHAFRVRTGNVTTTVLGTAFNVHAYPEEKNVTVTVARGKVKVSNAKEEYAVITPNQQLAVNKTTNTIAKAEMKVEVATEWKSTFLILDNVTLQAAAAMIGDKYNVKVLIADEIRDCKVQGAFINNESLDQVLDVMSLLIQGSFTTQDGVVTFTGKGCR